MESDSHEISVLPALTTPFVEGRVSPEHLRENLARYERLELGGYLVLGSTGETVLLERSERRRVLEAAREAIPDDKPMVAGVLTESTIAALDEARRLADGGADLALVGTPHYYGSQMTEQALMAHFEGVADASPLPVLLYNVPKFTGLTIPLPVVATLSRHEKIVGMKESSGDLDYFQNVLSGVESGFRVFCGAASILDSAFKAGATGAILAPADAFPEPFLDIARDVRLGNASDAARRLNKIVDAARTVAGVHGIPGIKAAMDLRGLYGGPVRSPLQSVSRTLRDEISSIVERLVETGAIPAREL